MVKASFGGMGVPYHWSGDAFVLGLVPNLEINEGTMKWIKEWEEEGWDEMVKLLKDWELERVFEDPEMLRNGWKEELDERDIGETNGLIKFRLI